MELQYHHVTCIKITQKTLNLTSDDPWSWYMTFDLINIHRNPYCIFDTSLVPIGLHVFKGDPNNENQHFHLTWPQMTLDLGMWPLTSLTYKGTPIASLTEVCLTQTSNFSKETQITKTYSQTGIYAPLPHTPHTFMASSMDHVFCYRTEDTQVWLSLPNQGQNVWFWGKLGFLTWYSTQFNSVFHD